MSAEKNPNVAYLHSRRNPFALFLVSTMDFVRNHPRLTGLASLTVLGGMVSYLGKRHLDKSCPRVSVPDIPRSSACRNLLERTGEPTSHTAWGMGKSTLLDTWSGSYGGDKTRWVPSFAALQVDVPTSLLAGYRASSSKDDAEKHDTSHLMQNLVAAFLDARAARPEAFFLDEAVPPLFFAPGSLLFGKRTSLGAFMLGTWSSTTGIPLRTPVLPSAAPQPTSEFPTNREIILGDPKDAAGAVMSWKFPEGLVSTVDKVASYGFPWRLVQGGYQEFIVEKVSDETVRVTYVIVECSDLHPRGQPARNFKSLPWLAYEVHVLYAQSLLYNTVRHLEKTLRRAE